MSRARIFWILFLGGAATAAVVDRVAVTVGNTVFTQSEVEDELRLSEFENGQPLDLAPAKRREAAERLVDQQLIRNEMEASVFTPPAPNTADALLNKFRQEHYPSAARFRAALERYGITQEQLKHYLLWELTVVQFINRRFRPLPTVAATPQDGAEASSADRAAPPGGSVNRQLDAFLKEARNDTKVVFKKEAFQ
jgi:hypothetical protein